MVRDTNHREKKDDIVVFWIRRASACAECGRELWKGELLRLEEERPLCLSCADLDHLAFLPSGDAAARARVGAEVERVLEGWRRG